MRLKLMTHCSKLIRQLEPGKAPGAAGGFEGFNTALYQVISDDRTIIVFANMDEPVAEHLALGILGLTRGNSPTLPSKPACPKCARALRKVRCRFCQSPL